MILPVKFKDIEVLAGSRLLLAEKVTHKWDGAVSYTHLPSRWQRRSKGGGYSGGAYGNRAV